MLQDGINLDMEKSGKSLRDILKLTVGDVFNKAPRKGTLPLPRNYKEKYPVVVTPKGMYALPDREGRKFNKNKKYTLLEDNGGRLFIEPEGTKHYSHSYIVGPRIKLSKNGPITSLVKFRKAASNLKKEAKKVAFDSFRYSTGLNRDESGIGKLRSAISLIKGEGRAKLTPYAKTKMKDWERIDTD